MKKGKTILLILLICLVTAKCADPSDQKSKFEQENQKIARLYQPIYEKGLRDDSLDDLDTIADIVKVLGESGYAAASYDNEIDMVHSEQMEDFCVKAGENKKAEQTLLLVQSGGDVVRCDLRAVNGEIEVYCHILSFEEGESVTDEGYRFVCYVWEYSDKGYLFLEEYRPKDLDGVPMNMAIRVKPLDEKCRQYNRKYVEPIGYNFNNIFITDWSEEDYGNLDFYDLYEPMYRMRWDDQEVINQLQEGIIYEIPEEEFEEVYHSYFKIHTQELRERTFYNEEKNIYQYRTRGMGDLSPTGTPPYPEVTQYRENEDGTLVLTVEAIWPERNFDCAFSHELTVRQLEDGSFQYVSNRVLLESADVFCPEWYRERLTEQEWSEFYGGE